MPPPDWTPDQENEFQAYMAFDPAVRDWRNKFQLKYGSSPRLEGGDFDYRTAYAAGNRPQPVSHDTVPHWDSRGKSADHPTTWMNNFMGKFGADPMTVTPGQVTPEMQTMVGQQLDPFAILQQYLNGVK